MNSRSTLFREDAFGRKSDQYIIFNGHTNFLETVRAESAEKKVKFHNLTKMFLFAETYIYTVVAFRAASARITGFEPTGFQCLKLQKAVKLTICNL